jgi:CRISPR-associated protein Cmr5
MAQLTDKPRQTLEQRRGNRAWEAIQKVLRDFPHQQKNNKLVPHPEAKKYGGQAKKLPTRIMAAGLGQALAFLKSKGYAPGLLAELTEWIGTRIPPRQGEPKDLLERIVKGDSDFLRRATDEVLAYLLWLNRLAKAEGLTEGEES